jgi:hypothetical protein
LEFRLITSGAFVGKIVNESGKPLSGIGIHALVKASTSRLFNGEALAVMPELDLAPIRTAVTNDLGEYRLYGLPPTPYFLCAVDSGMPHLSEQMLGGVMFSPEDLSRSKYPPIFHPGTPEKDRALAVTLGSGEEKRVDFHLQRFTTRTVEGDVVDPDAKPAVGVFVHAMPLDMVTLFGGLQLSSLTDSEGHFKIVSVPPGKYILRATQIRGGEERTFADLKLDVREQEQETRDVRLTLRRGQKLSGKILVEGGSQFDLGQIHVWLTPLDQDLQHFDTAAAQVKSDGAFDTNRDLADTVYGIHLTGLPEDWYLKSARLANEDVLLRGLTISADVAPASLQLLVAPDGTRVRGTVRRDDQPPDAAALALQLEPANYHRFTACGFTDQRGECEFRGVPPGNYRLNVNALPSALTFSEEKLKDFPSTSMLLTAKAGETLMVTIKL